MLFPGVGSCATIVALLLALFEGVKEVQGHPGGIRRRRQSGRVYYVDLVVVVDSAMYAKWLDPGPASTLQSRKDLADRSVKDFVSLIIYQANARLGTLQQHLPFSIQLRIQRFELNVDLLSRIPVSPLGGRSADEALVNLTNWVVKKDLTSYDHVILMTGYDLDDTDRGTSYITGKAYVGSMCLTNGQSISVVEAWNGFQSAQTVAHEISHSLGAFHDGQNNSCRHEDRYLLAADDSAPRTESNLANPWYFSDCSATAINTFVDGILQRKNGIRNCLSIVTRGPGDDVFVASASVVPGQIYDANAQCNLLLGASSRLCLGPDFGELPNICTSMYCLKPDGKSCSRYFAAEGTSCASGKWCQLGRCVASSKAPELANQDCAFGDRIISINSQTCQEHVLQNPQSCYDEQIRSNCCRSCELAKRYSEMCPYGDRVLGCKTTDCNYIYPDGTLYAASCCDTCKYDVERQCQDDISANGISCADLTVQGGIERCYDGFVAFQCCATCSRRRRDIKDCEYGDLDLSCSVPDPESCSDDQKKRCCQSCKTANGAVPYSRPLPIVLGLVCFLVRGMVTLMAR